MLLARAESSPVDGLPLERRSLILIALALACRSARGGGKQATRTVPPYMGRWFDICDFNARPRNARGRRISKAVEEGLEEADEVVSRESRQTRQGSNAW